MSRLDELRAKFVEAYASWWRGQHVEVITYSEREARWYDYWTARDAYLGVRATVSAGWGDA